MALVRSDNLEYDTVLAMAGGLQAHLGQLPWLAGLNWDLVQSKLHQGLVVLAIVTKLKNKDLEKVGFDLKLVEIKDSYSIITTIRLISNVACPYIHSIEHHLPA